MEPKFPDEHSNCVDEQHKQIAQSKKDIQPVIESQQGVQKTVEVISAAIQRMNVGSTTMESFRKIAENSVFKNLGKLAISYHLPDYNYISPLLESINKNTAFAAIGMGRTVSLFGEYIQKNQELIRSITSSMYTLTSGYSNVFDSISQSPVFQWLNSLDAFPVRSILEDLQIQDNELYERNEELEGAYYAAMIECKWFPQAALTGDLGLFAEVIDIMATSRGASTRREKRIDKVILDYYDKTEIQKIKRSWKKGSMDTYIKRILGQAIDAHIRGEYALTIASLATMWEGLIYVKANNVRMQDRHRQKMQITKEEFAKLTKANDYNSIFNDYFDRLIVSQCNAVEDVLEGVPNRHGVSHSWYHKYPNKKASLNAILLTDFLIKLEPITDDESDE